MPQPWATLTATVLDAPDAHKLADFYRHLLGWEVVADEQGWVKLEAPHGGAGLSFQSEPEYTPPSWPSHAGIPQMQMHLDIEVSDLAAACARVEEAGATAALFQPQQDVRVYLDPAGHPFCLWVRT